jgi:putative endonuclease
VRAHPAGASWEQLAEAHLRDRGLELLERNFHCRLGEIDLVMRDGDVTVFVEVRYRSDIRFGGALETVDHRKQLKIQRAAGIFLSRRPGWAAQPCRFDIVGIEGNPEQPSIYWLKSAFEAA